MPFSFLRRILIAAAVTGVVVTGGVAGGAAGAEPVPLDARIIMSGHSLTEPIAEPLRRMLAESGVTRPVVDVSSIGGSPMEIRWRKHEQAQPVNARAMMRNYDVLVVTERVGLSNTVQYHDSPGRALQWATHAWRNGNGGKGAPTFLYASWVDIVSGPGWKNQYKDPDGHLTFRERMPIEMAAWEAIAAHVNERLDAEAPRMRIIPGPLVMLAALDAVEAGRMPGIGAFSELFTDDIHLNDRGAYLIALAHYAVLYGRDPRELPDRIGDRGDEELAAFMQDLVAGVIEAYRQPADAARS